MKVVQFRSIADDIEGNLGAGEGYTINVRTRSGDCYYDVAWAPLGVRSSFSVIVLSLPDKPPVYMDVAAIETVELCA